MREFRKYDHVERFGTPQVEGIEIGETYIFPKLDGSNGGIFLDESGKLRANSRTRELGDFQEGDRFVTRDNLGFYTWLNLASNSDRFLTVLKKHPNWYLYGEWLKPHTIKSYRADSWDRFWVFDVWDFSTERYVHYNDYSPVLREHEIDFIEPLCIFTSPSEGQLQKEVEHNYYLMQDGAVGEGIVIKNYSFTNKFGRQPWAKIVRNGFKEENRRAFGTLEKGGEFQVEGAIAEHAVTKALVEKERAKILLAVMAENGAQGTAENVEYEYRSKMIPRLLQTVFHCVVTEELWAALKKYKNPTVDFKKLQRHVTHWTKQHASDLFR